MLSILPLSTSHILVATSHYHLQAMYISLSWFDMQGPALHTISFWVGVNYWQTSWCYKEFYCLVWCWRFKSYMAVIMILFVITTFHWKICCLTFFMPIVRPYLAHWFWHFHIHDNGIGRTAGVTSRQGMLTLLGTWSYLWWFQGSMYAWCSIYLIWAPILTVNIFRLPDLTVWFWLHN
jgi:hypothetical protein